jgi:hypothetical protein
MPHVLRRLRLKRVSLVDNPANQDARVVLFKSADCECNVCKDVQSTDSRNALSDADFAAVWTDAEGRKQRKLPIHDAAHVRNALARWSQTDLPADVKDKARRKLEAKAKELGIGDYAKQQPSSSEVNVPGMVQCKKCNAYVAKDAKTCKSCGAAMPDPTEPDADDKAKAAKEKKAMDEKMKADLDEAMATVKALTAERDDLKKKLEAHENTPEQIEKRKLEALPESVRKRLEDGEAKVAKLEAEKAEAEQVAFVKSALPQIPGKYEEVGGLLKRAKDALKAEDFEALTKILKAASEQIEKGGLFREAGKPGDGAVSNPLAQIDALAEAIVAKDASVTKSAARARVIADHPELYDAYTRSMTLGANSAAARADAN